MNRPTGIIRTLPYFGAETMNRAFALMMAAFKALESGKQEATYIAFAQRPTIEVLHCYILVEGKIVVRANISHWEQGDGRAVRYMCQVFASTL
jgi:hypothetical protein